MINVFSFEVAILGHEFNLISLIIICLAIIFAIWQILFHYVYFLKLIQYKFKADETAVKPSVSVVICAKNEKENLREHLESILEQDYPDFEVVVVNDSSWDGTEEILSFFTDKFPHLKIVSIKEEIKRIEGKKFPLTLGIKAAKNEIMLLTDADCHPTSKHWISEMMAPYANTNIEMVLGYSPYQYRPGLLNLLIRAETSLSAMMYVSFALKGSPYMGVGRNLSYKKELFFRHKGFASHHHIPSGDDDLFVRDASTSTNTAIVISPQSRMLSLPKVSFTQWFRQKKRHLFVGRYYNPNIKKKLAAFSISHLFFWFFAIALFFFSPSIWIPLCIILCRWLLQAPIIYLAFKKLGHNMLAFLMPLLDLAYLFYSIFSGLVYFFSKKPKW
ncbi:MAG: glycosyltransferase [Bacteroidia bacterium]|jgi:glycosyltransferase involved in cell wall biosynthesis|nr:glycosyltransferase [Bacteroidia bacterium]MCO5253774.1 glycosyltransferase [Bacteroidota bacterium]MCZ2130808.1 glycosyltransferase [Bacteroidia bacterium]